MAPAGGLSGVSTKQMLEVRLRVQVCSPHVQCRGAKRPRDGLLR